MSFLGFGKKKGPEPSASARPSQAATPSLQPEPQPAEPSVSEPAVSAPAASPAGDWRQPSLTSLAAHDVGMSQEQFDAAFVHARKENDRGAPFGGAVWGALMPVARNHQAVDDLVDELPDEAFGPCASPHFEVIIRCWSRAVASESRPDWQTFKSLAMAGGWRPGDANAALLYEQVAGEPPFLRQARHPMGLDILPREFMMSRMEMAVYGFLNSVLDRAPNQSVQ